MKDYKLRFTNEAQAKSVLSAFVVDDVLQTESQAGSLIIQGEITPYDNTDPENPVALPPLDGFFVFMRSRKHTNEYDAYLTTEPLLNVSFGPLPPPPSTVGPLQFRRALRDLGLKAAIEAVLATQSEEVVESYEYATVFNRTDPLLVLLAQGMQIPESVIDEVFWLASEKG